MCKLEIGQPYVPGCHTWPEGADYNFRSGGHELRIFLANVTSQEIATIHTAPVEFGLLVDRSGLFLIARFGRRFSFDCSYSWHRVSPEERTMPPPFEEVPPALRSSISVILVEATTGIVAALRVISFSPDFSRGLHRAILEQAQAVPHPIEHERWVGETFRCTTHQLWERCQVRCQGGAD